MYGTSDTGVLILASTHTDHLGTGSWKPAKFFANPGPREQGNSGGAGGKKGPVANDMVGNLKTGATNTNA